MPPDAEIDDTVAMATASADDDEGSGEAAGGVGGSIGDMGQVDEDEDADGEEEVEMEESSDVKAGNQQLECPACCHGLSKHVAHSRVLGKCAEALRGCIIRAKIEGSWWRGQIISKWKDEDTGEWLYRVLYIDDYDVEDMTAERAESFLITNMAQAQKTKRELPNKTSTNAAGVARRQSMLSLFAHPR